jgi:hypothetical protein
VAYVTERQGGNYYHFKNGVVLVKHSNISGGWTCLFSHCIGAKKANDCHSRLDRADLRRNAPPRS